MRMLISQPAQGHFGVPAGSGNSLPHNISQLRTVGKRIGCWLGNGKDSDHDRNGSTLRFARDRSEKAIAFSELFFHEQRAEFFKHDVESLLNHVAAVLRRGLWLECLEIPRGQP